jgi:hypothetical protein
MSAFLIQLKTQPFIVVSTVRAQSGRQTFEGLNGLVKPAIRQTGYPNSGQHLPQLLYHES